MRSVICAQIVKFAGCLIWTYLWSTAKRRILILYLEMLNNKEEYPDYPELEIWSPCLHKVISLKFIALYCFTQWKMWNGMASFFCAWIRGKKSILVRLIKESSIIFRWGKLFFKWVFYYNYDGHVSIYSFNLTLLFSM